jgi:hypothetical protein
MLNGKNKPGDEIGRTGCGSKECQEIVAEEQEAAE